MLDARKRSIAAGSKEPVLFEDEACLLEDEWYREGLWKKLKSENGVIFST
jgi:hypothetical protein